MGFGTGLSCVEYARGRDDFCGLEEEVCRYRSFAPQVPTKHLWWDSTLDGQDICAPDYHCCTRECSGVEIGHGLDSLIMLVS
jgi:hypothetical protein